MKEDQSPINRRRNLEGRIPKIWNTQIFGPVVVVLSDLSRRIPRYHPSLVRIPGAFGLNGSKRISEESVPVGIGEPIGGAARSTRPVLPPRRRFTLASRPEKGRAPGPRGLSGGPGARLRAVSQSPFSAVPLLASDDRTVGFRVKDGGNLSSLDIRTSTASLNPPLASRFLWKRGS